MHAQGVRFAPPHPRIQRRDFLRECTRGVAAMVVVQIASQARGSERRHNSSPMGFNDASIAEIENLVDKLMRDSRVPGVSISIVRNGKLVWQRGFGVKDAASNEPVDDQTVFEAASMSKPVFAYVVMKLREKGVIGVDTPLTRYSPQRFVEGDARLDLITARHVLSQHTTGFRDWRSKDNPLKIHFTPGSQFDCAGEAYFYLQSPSGRSHEPKGPRPIPVRPGCIRHRHRRHDAADAADAFRHVRQRLSGTNLRDALCTAARRGRKATGQGEGDERPMPRVTPPPAVCKRPREIMQSL